MSIEELFNRAKIVDLSFFNFRNAITACYFADPDLRILRVNDNFRAFFPVLADVTDAYFPDVLERLGVDAESIATFAAQMQETGRAYIPHVSIAIEGRQRAFSLMSTRTDDSNFSYLKGVQGQFVDRTAEWELRREREALVEQKLRDRELIEQKTRELERIANRLAKYLSPQIYNSIFTGASEASDPLARKNLTIFFSDIEHFTDISDGMEPERLAFFINTYLSEMSDIAIEYGGTIDKFIGDAILIFFGDPETEGDRQDALKCARMAIRMRERVRQLEKVWHAHGIAKPLRVRMAITTGFCTVGNFGSQHRIEYTVLGSPVNLASRLQANAAPDTILLGDSTYLLIRDAADCATMPDLNVKGFARPVVNYRLDGIKGDGEASREVSRVGRHVAVSIPDSRRIREAIEELRRIQIELEAHLPADESGQPDA
ncbi:MAG: adenylate/guanylate cyclase domain-containing protein [Cucumibacter sp.]